MHFGTAYYSGTEKEYTIRDTAKSASHAKAISMYRRTSRTTEVWMTIGGGIVFIRQAVSPPDGNAGVWGKWKKWGDEKRPDSSVEIDI